MSNGRKLTLEEAKEIILAFEEEQTQVLKRPLEEVGIGQKLDLSLLEDFIAAIKAHPKSHEIDAVRIYLGKSIRPGSSVKQYDIVLVPVFKDGHDIHKVYDVHPLTALDTLIGNTLPCPNVCPNGFMCK
ncbi:hypothetical protein BWI96_05970 [Siphonobacter sp. SORGH_AS_0500]|uniref:hypothetical protein n=1 Tax=Siphonobacter sp. SORGH_AS_0500 TaxID=1864824 RepID=UPI000CC6E7FD|nr:hypothetical protein [Siphonobacter sp. SORGH_AS_0500]PKK37414.1 hypothetical protein BWI96_05970 [Siphonobacter sp. SORGH_AS_0500]